MLTAIISDFHGMNPMKVIERLKKQKVKRFVFLGDYDMPEILEDLLDLDADKLFVPGNHDAAMVKEEEIYSPHLVFGWRDYAELWRSHPKARDFVLKQAEGGLKLEKKFARRKIVYVHGNLASDERQPEIEGRVLENWQVRENLMRMHKENIWLMIRGHDHLPSVYSASKNKCKSGTGHEQEFSLNIKLNPHRRYIITVGSFKEKYYALLNSRNQTIEIIPHLGERTD